MAINWDEFLGAGAQGFASGYLPAMEAKRKAEYEMGGEMWKEKLKQQMQKELIESSRPPSGARIKGYSYVQGTGYVPQYEEPSEKETLETQLLREALGGAGGGEGQYRREGFTVGGQSFKRVPTAEEEKVRIEKEAQELETKERIKQVSKARKDLDTYASDANQALLAIDKIERQAKKLPTFQRGFMAQVGAKGKTELAKFSKEENVTRYLGVVSQELIPMARKLMEEKGPITEFDVSRVEKGLGEITTPIEDKIFLLNELRDKVKKALKNKAQVAEIGQGTFAEKYKGLYRKAFLKRPQDIKPGQFKAGDVRVKNGISYQRNEAGQWLPMKKS